MLPPAATFVRGWVKSNCKLVASRSRVSRASRLSRGAVLRGGVRFDMAQFSPSRGCDQVPAARPRPETRLHRSLSHLRMAPKQGQEFSRFFFPAPAPPYSDDVAQDRSGGSSTLPMVHP